MIAEKRRITAEDLYNLRFVGDPQISPAGNEVAFTLTTINEDKDYTSAIYITAPKGEISPFTNSGKKDVSPRWSPRGDQLAFVSNRSGDRQIWLLPRHGGEARQLTHMCNEAFEPVWSPDGKKIAFLSGVGPEETVETLLKSKSAAERDKEKEEKSKKVKVIKDLSYKSDDSGFLTDKTRQIWIIDVANGEAKRVSTLPRNYSKPIWSPDGKKLAAIREIADADYHPGYNELVLIDLLSGGEQNILPAGMEANMPSWSPDGEHIAFFGHRHEFKGATLTKIYVISLADMNVKSLAAERGLCIGDACMSDLRAGGFNPGPVWSADGESVITFVSEWGSSNLYSFGLDGQVKKLVSGKRQIFGFSMDADRQKIAFAYTTPLLPGDLAMYDVHTGEEKLLTELNKDFLAAVKLSEPEEFIFKGAEDWNIQGWVMKPVDFTEGQKYPLILEIHGGPHTMYSNSFFLEFQLLAANGYGVVYCNPRGSHGYSQKFVDAVRGDYGGNDYKDLMACVDYTLKWAWVDADKLGVTGGSYGGYMTNWIVSHTDRFKAAVTQRSISNWNSFAGVSDIGYFFADWEHKIDFIKHRDELIRISPITYVENIQTPLLILHSEHDYRCPLEQAEQLYIYLKFLRRETRLVIFPGSNHNLSRNGKPELRVERLNQIVGWFNEYIHRNS